MYGGRSYRPFYVAMVRRASTVPRMHAAWPLLRINAGGVISTPPRRHIVRPTTLRMYMAKSVRLIAPLGVTLCYYINYHGHVVCVLGITDFVGAFRARFVTLHSIPLYALYRAGHFYMPTQMPLRPRSRRFPNTHVVLRDC